jgi:hypothetical protein
MTLASLSQMHVIKTEKEGKYTRNYAFDLFMVDHEETEIKIGSNIHISL